MAKNPNNYEAPIKARRSPHLNKKLAMLCETIAKNVIHASMVTGKNHSEVINVVYDNMNLFTDIIKLRTELAQAQMMLADKVSELF